VLVLNQGRKRGDTLIRVNRDKMKQFMKDERYSSITLAAAVGVSRNTINNVMTGRKGVGGGLYSKFYAKFPKSKLTGIFELDK